MCNVTLHIYIPVSMGKQYTFKLYFVKPLLEIKLPFWACLSSLSIKLILCSTVQCKKKSSLWNIYHNILKGLWCLFRPQLLPIAQIQSPFFSYGLCFQRDENDTWGHWKWQKAISHKEVERNVYFLSFYFLSSCTAWQNTILIHERKQKVQ